MNGVNLIGNLTRDPHTRETKGAKPVCTLRLAVSARGKDADPVYVDVVAFERQAEVCDEYLRKGRRVAVSGRLGHSEWESDGNKRSKHEVITERVEFLSTGAREENGGGERDPRSERAAVRRVAATSPVHPAEPRPTGRDSAYCPGVAHGREAVARDGLRPPARGAPGQGGGPGPGWSPGGCGSKTRDLPTPIAQRWIDEIDADLHDHIAHERANGTSERRIALSILSRMRHGVAADASWRGQTIAHPSTAKQVMKMSRSAYRSAVRVTLATGSSCCCPWWGCSSSMKSTGVCGRLRCRRSPPGRNRSSARARSEEAGQHRRRAAAAAIVLGQADDAPGLVLFGGLLIVGTVALGVRTAQRSE